jgi:hypothetical protein
LQRRKTSASDNGLTGGAGVTVFPVSLSTIRPVFASIVMVWPFGVAAGPSLSGRVAQAAEAAGGLALHAADADAEDVGGLLEAEVGVVPQDDAGPLAGRQLEQRLDDEQPVVDRSDHVR